MICNQSESLTISSTINAISTPLAADFSKLEVRNGQFALLPLAKGVCFMNR